MIAPITREKALTKKMLVSKTPPAALDIMVGTSSFFILVFI